MLDYGTKRHSTHPGREGTVPWMFPSLSTMWTSGCIASLWSPALWLELETTSTFFGGFSLRNYQKQ